MSRELTYSQRVDCGTQSLAKVLLAVQEAYLIQKIHFQPVCSTIVPPRIGPRILASDPMIEMIVMYSVYSLGETSLGTQTMTRENIPAPPMPCINLAAMLRTVNVQRSIREKYKVTELSSVVNRPRFGCYSLGYMIQLDCAS